eukprot:TRINITY_DN5640_c0_g1_i8.p1 TRINITY_DN5640_c0_g1~~TRINITY_DN5640_c0_g1_i8.p1  ORF type:complete len:517 (+),score=87.48 TRINITY_DN5640_c0_g1_i8:250-1800(+)
MANSSIVLDPSQKRILKEIAFELDDARKKYVNTQTKTKEKAFGQLFEHLLAQGFEKKIKSLKDAFEIIGYSVSTKRFTKSWKAAEFNFHLIRIQAAVLSHCIIGDEYIYGSSQSSKFGIVDYITAGGQGTVYSGWMVEIDPTTKAELSQRREIIVKMQPTVEIGSIFNEGIQLMFLNKILCNTPTRIGVYLSDKIQEMRGGRERLLPVSFLLMERLGQSLDQVLKGHGGKLESNLALQYGKEMISLTRRLHENNFVHRDIKPSNFTLGPPGSAVANDVHLIDFGLVVHIPYPPKGVVEFVGTPVYASVHAHQCIHQQYYRDDMISVGYVMLVFLTGNLPWKETMSLAEIQSLKEEISIPKLCEGVECPHIRGFLIDYLETMTALGPMQKPSYDVFEKRISQLIRIQNKFTSPERKPLQHTGPQTTPGKKEIQTKLSGFLQRDPEEKIGASKAVRNLSDIQFAPNKRNVDATRGQENQRYSVDEPGPKKFAPITKLVPLPEPGRRFKQQASGLSEDE